MEANDNLWASANWEATSVDQHPWLQANKEEISAVDPHQRRWFVPRGCRWPLLSVTVYEAYSTTPVGVLISVAYKQSAFGWFDSCNLPRVLVPTLIEMLQGISASAKPAPLGTLGNCPRCGKPWRTWGTDADPVAEVICDNGHSAPHPWKAIEIPSQGTRMSHSKSIADSAELVLFIGEQLRDAFCDHQAFFVLVFDDHTGAIPVVEDLLKRPLPERQRAADVLRMWAARIENGIAPEMKKA